MAAALFLLAATVPVLSVASTGAPLFGWSSDARTFKDAESVQVGNTYKSAEFISQHMPTNANSVVVVFVQDGLSLDHISDKSSEMQFIKNSMESAASSIFVPSVSNTETMFRGANAVRFSADAVSQKDLSGKNVLIVTLGYSADGETMNKVLKALPVAPSAVFVTGTGSYGSVTRARRGESGVSMEPISAEECTSKACRVYRNPNKAAPIYSFASKAFLTAIPVLLTMIVILCAGIFGLMVLETNEKFPSVDDVPLIISTRNE